MSKVIDEVIIDLTSLSANMTPINLKSLMNTLKIKRLGRYDYENLGAFRMSSECETGPVRGAYMIYYGKNDAYHIFFIPYREIKETEDVNIETDEVLIVRITTDDRKMIFLNSYYCIIYGDEDKQKNAVIINEQIEF